MPQRKISTSSTNEDNMHKILSSTIYETSSNCSSESLVFAIERFFKSVNTMSSVVMFPSKLVDIEDEPSDTEVEPALSSASSDCSVNSSSECTNLFQVFNMLVTAKNDLVWRRDDPSGPGAQLAEAEQFKYHLESLYALLHNFSNMADHLTDKYQSLPGIKEGE
ncbi:Mid1-interacting protein 1-like [Halotydeus destructor]|nr:Mid1-interacting protein 1-like [Halotydeus destructor]